LRGVIIHFTPFFHADYFCIDAAGEKKTEVNKRRMIEKIDIVCIFFCNFGVEKTECRHRWGSFVRLLNN
jgi:hypothetical protein